jgi:hypothetical protein
MSNIEARSIVNGFDRIRRSAKERQHHILNERAYRGVPTKNEAWITKETHGTFTYRGVKYTK